MVRGMPYSGLGGKVNVGLIRSLVGLLDYRLNGLKFFPVNLNVIVRLTVVVFPLALVALMSDDLGVRGSELHPRRRNDRYHRIHHRHLGHLGRSMIAQETSKSSHRLGVKLVDSRLADSEHFADFLKG